MKDFKRLDLQFFAEGEGGGGDDGAGAGEEGAGSNETLSFDDFLHREETRLNLTDACKRQSILQCRTHRKSGRH